VTPEGVLYGVGAVDELDLLWRMSPSDASVNFINGGADLDYFAVHYGKTYVERRIVASIVLSVIAVTLIWGYAHLLSPVNCIYRESDRNGITSNQFV